MPLPDCNHTEGFRCHVSDRGGHWAICRGCGTWQFLDGQGNLASYARQDEADVLEHDRTVQPGRSEFTR